MKKIIIAFIFILATSSQVNAFEMSESIQYLYPDAEPGIDFTIKSDATGESFAYWNSALGAQPSLDTLEAAWPAAQLEREKIRRYEDIVAEARLRVLALKPTWTEDNFRDKQRRAMGRAQKLQRKESKGTASAGEIAELNALEGVFDLADSILDTADTLEDTIEASDSFTFVSEFDATDSGHWP